MQRYVRITANIQYIMKNFITIKKKLVKTKAPLKNEMSKEVLVLVTHRQKDNKTSLSGRIKQPKTL